MAKYSKFEVVTLHFWSHLQIYTYLCGFSTNYLLKVVGYFPKIDNFKIIRVHTVT